MATEQTYRGSCHCGAVKFEAVLDLKGKGTTRCNCSYCTKLGYWGCSTKPDKFRLLSGQESLGDYSKSDWGHHRFCTVCAIQTHTRGDLHEYGGPYVSVNVRVLDVDKAELEDIN